MMDSLFGRVNFDYGQRVFDMKHANANERVCSQQRNATDIVDSQQRKRQKKSSVFCRRLLRCLLFVVKGTV
jgi:hypothetical protein